MAERLTRTDIRRIEEEIEHRKVVVRRKLIDDVKEARAHGDLSENFEYHAAKKEKNANESRIAYLERMLKTAIVVEEGKNDDEVGLNRKVDVYFPDDDETESFVLVTSIRGDSLSNRISIESPLGKAIIGKKTGDRSTVLTESGASYDVVIKSVGPREDERDSKLKTF